MSNIEPTDDRQLFQEIRQLIDTAKQRAAVAVNAQLTLLYWQVGQRIQTQILQGDRAEYGKKIINTLSQQLTQTYGKGWSPRQLRQCVHFATIFPDLEKVNALCAKLSWSHLRILSSVEDTLKRDFYIELAQLEKWSVRQLQERINAMLYERTALSRKPEETIRYDLDQLRKTKQVSPDFLLKDPYILDFLQLNDRYLERDIEDAILRDIEQFLLELGAGFSFIARQKHLQIDSDDLGASHFRTGEAFGIKSVVLCHHLLPGKLSPCPEGYMQRLYRYICKYEMHPMTFISISFSIIAN